MDKRKTKVRIIFPLGKGNINRRIEFHQSYKNNSKKSNPKIEQSIQPQRFLDAVNILANRIPTDRQTSHKNRQNNRDGQMGTTENQC